MESKRKKACAAVSAAIAAHRLSTLCSTSIIVSLSVSTHCKQTGTREHRIESAWRHPTPSFNSSESQNVDRQLHAITLQPENSPLKILEGIEGHLFGYISSEGNGRIGFFVKVLEFRS